MQEAFRSATTRVSCRCCSHTPGTDLAVPAITSDVLETSPSRRAEPGLSWAADRSWPPTVSWPLPVWKSPIFRAEQSTLPLRAEARNAICALKQSVDEGFLFWPAMAAFWMPVCFLAVQVRFEAWRMLGQDQESHSLL